MEFTLSPPVDRLAATLPVGLLAKKVCGGCKLEKELDCFWVYRRAPDGLQSRCMECMSAAQKTRQALRRKAEPGRQVSRRGVSEYRREAEEARRILREEEEERNAPSPAVIRFKARIIKLLNLRRTIDAKELAYAPRHYGDGLEDDWRDPFPGIKFVTRSRIEDQPQICDCPYWQHEIQHVA